MFDFGNLIVYQKAKQTNKDIVLLIKRSNDLDSAFRNQLRRASLSIPVNIAEGWPALRIQYYNATDYRCYVYNAPSDNS